jgi:hypothetical protein
MSQVMLLLLLPLLAAPPTGAADPVVQISFGDLLAPGPKLVPSPRLATLKGRRVRLVGFMAELEDPPRGAFYLTARPVRCDEGGGGTGDLPPDAVRVIVRSAAGQEIPFYPGPLEVSGVLELGTQADEDGRPSFFRISLDRSPTPNGGQVP